MGENLHGVALAPDAVFYLRVPPEELIQRNSARNHAPDYWESGMDLGLARDMFDSFLRDQAMVAGQFERLQKNYGFSIVDATRSVEEINPGLRRRISGVTAGRK